MRLNPDDFEQVWQHICAYAREDQGRKAFIPSFAERGGNWVEAIERDKS